MVDITSMGDMTIRDITVRDINVKENASVKSLLVEGDVKIKGNLEVTGDTVMVSKLPENAEFTSLTLNSQWRLIAVDGLLFFQKFINGEWVNKQALS